MKTEVRTTPVESGGLVTQGQFKIKQSAKAFSVLSSGLYSNKHQAILRELGCNAYDSHVEAGKGDEPFVVHLPSKLNPVFYVEDFGIGLDHDGVVNIYTTYFESTKQDSNDYVGCLGLGSKSPFSYTDNFTVIARKDGIERTYTAFINEEGVPAIALLGEHETDKPNGVRVQFAVNDRNDMYRFKEEAAKVFKWFKVQPKFTGQEVNIPELKYAEKDIIPGVHIRDTKKEYGYRSEQSYAIMGNVAYPISLESVEDDDDHRNRIRTMFDEGSLVVEFAIGDLDIAASREELSYIPHTLESIYRKGEEIIEHLGTYIEKELTGAKTKWERTEVLNRLYRSNRNLFAPAITSYIKKNPRKFFKYTRFDYSGCKTYFALRDFYDISDHLKVSYYNIAKRYADNMLVAHRMKQEQVVEDEDEPRDKREYVSAYNIDFDSVTVVMQDDRGGVLPRIKAAASSKQISTRHVLSFRVTDKDADKDAIYKKVKRLLGNPTIVWTSSLPKTNTTHLKSKKLSVFKFYETYGSYNSEKWKWKLQTDVSKLGHAIPQAKGQKQRHVYVPLQHKSVSMPDGGTYSPDGFMRWMVDNGVAKLLRIDPKKVYGINKTTRKLIANDKNWVNLFDLFLEKFEEIDWALAKEEARRKYIRRLVKGGEYDFELCKPKALAELKELDSPFGKLTAFFVENKNTTNASEIPYDRLIIARRMIGGDEKKLKKLEKNLEVETLDKDIGALFKEVKKTYPMLKHLNLNSRWNTEHWNDALHYVKLVDSTQ